MAAPFTKHRDGEPDRRSFLAAAGIAAAGMYVAREYGPVFDGAVIGHGTAVNAVAGIAALAAVANGCIAASEACGFIADKLSLAIAKTPVGNQGTARFAQYQELLHDITPYSTGLPYWGTYAGRGRHRGKAIFADFESTAHVLGPSGSGKTTKLVQTNILAIRHSKTVIDFKSELAPILARALQERGEIVRIINLGDLFADRLTHVSNDSYNVLCIITDCFKTPGRLRDLSEILHELCLELYPEPKGGKSDDIYFRNGSRRLIRFAILACIIVTGDAATLGDVLEMLSDRELLLFHAQWITGELEGLDEDGNLITHKLDLRDMPWIDRHNEADIADFIRYITALAAAISTLMGGGGENKTLESFLSGAIDMLDVFNVMTRAHHKTGATSFRFSEQKDSDKPVTVFIMIDANKKESQSRVLGLLQWAMLHEMKAHPNKDRSVYCIIDEASNVPLSNVGGLMTYARAYGLRLMFIFQTYPAFKQAHSEDALEILLSESEISCILPGQRNPQTLTMLEKSLGTRPVMTQSAGASRNHEGINSYNISESGRPVLTAEEIRRMKHGMVIIRQQRALPSNHPSIAEIRPWATQIDNNPFHDKPYIKKARLHVKTRKGGGA